jgi:hypothetical protein
MSLPTYSRPWLAGLYPLALVLVVVPLMDAVTRTLPVRPDDAGWRFGSLGLVLNSLVTPILGLALAAGVSLFLEQRATLRTWSVMAWVGAAFTLILLALFVLDFLELRGTVTVGARGGFDALGVKTAVSAGLGLCALIGLAAGSGRAARQLPGRSRRSDRPDLVVGQTRT